VEEGIQGPDQAAGCGLIVRTRQDHLVRNDIGTEDLPVAVNVFQECVESSQALAESADQKLPIGTGENMR
jgi:hypothetical protein